MTDELPIKDLHRIFGVGRITSEKKPNGWKKAWSWTCMSNDAVAVIAPVLIYLRNKRQQGEVAMAFSETLLDTRRGYKLSDDVYRKRRGFYWYLRELKKKSVDSQKDWLFLCD